MITGLQGEIQETFGDAHTAGADEVEDGFDFVGEGGDGVETEHGAGAFDGVHGPEDPVDKFLVIGGLLQLQKGGFQLGQKFARFFPIGGDGLFQHVPTPVPF